MTVGIDPDGELAPQLGALEAGDGVRIAGPFGSEYYDGESRAVVLAGGPGVGPAVGIAERALDDGNEAAVVYQDDAPVHEDRLDALAEAGALVSVIDSEESLAEPVADAIEDGGQVSSTASRTSSTPPRKRSKLPASALTTRKSRTTDRRSVPSKRRLAGSLHSSHRWERC